GGGVAVGNTIIVTFAMDAGPTPVANDVTCTDNGAPANTYTKNAEVRNGSGTSGVRTVVFSAPVTAALAAGNTITVSFPSTVAKAVSVNAFPRLVSPVPADQSGIATGATNAPTVTTSGATTQAEELVVGAFGREGKGNEFGAVGAGFTGLPQATTATTGMPAAHTTIDSEFRVVTDTGTQTANQTSWGELWAAAVVTYRSICGNGSVDAGESCDTGAANGTAGSCCTGTCGFVTAGTTCRAAANE